MELFNIAALLITLSAIFGYVNYRYLKMPNVIGVMSISILLSLAMLIFRYFGHSNFIGEGEWAQLASGINFSKTLMVGMLGFLLFAGGLHVDLAKVKKQKVEIVLFSTLGVVISTFIIGALAYYAFHLVGLNLRFVFCLLFGALISPTDPIAVLSILKNAGAEKDLETLITAESLFNDGVGVVLFATLLTILDGQGVSVGNVALFFIQEAVGGALFGLLLGWAAFSFLKKIDNFQVEVLITLALVMGGYSLASSMHVSGPIAMVVAGLLLGNHGRDFAMSPKARESLYMFWGVIVETLNSLLFVIIGIELLVIPISRAYFLAGAIAIPITLLARSVSVGVPLTFLNLRKKFPLGSFKIMTWSGLRGGISIALALSLPPGPEKEVILAMTYTVVVFSILAQGLTMGWLIKKLQA
jgi:CPA1 family monovalent cation:H+ antiporter